MNIEHLTLRPLQEYNLDDICRLVHESFANGTDFSDGELEKRLVREIVSKPWYLPELAFVAELDGDTVGFCMLSKFPVLGGHEDEILILTPVAVDYRYLRQGIGKRMLTLAIERAKATAFKGIIVEGNPAFYHTVGFNCSGNFGITAEESVGLPAPECLMAMELYEGALASISGTVHYEMYDCLKSLDRE